MKKHPANHSGYTGRAKDWMAMLAEEFGIKKEALAREAQLKGWKNRTRIETLIEKNMVENR